MSPVLDANQSPRFLTTRWSVVLHAGGDSREGRQALSTLAESYWYPLFAYARRRGQGAEEACDLVQGLFTRLLEKDAFRDLAPDRGRFRAFLQVCLKNLLADERGRATTLRRGGGRVLSSLDARDADRRFATEPVDEETPERVFHRQWARAVLERAMDRLATTYRERGQQQQFQELSPRLTGEGGEETLQDVAGRLGMTENAVKVALHRLRQRYGAALREEVAGTVEDPNDLDQEIRELREALR